MKKLWLNIKAVNIVIVAVAIYALILFATLCSGIYGAFKKLNTPKANG